MIHASDQFPIEGWDPSRDLSGQGAPPNGAFLLFPFRPLKAKERKLQKERTELKKATPKTIPRGPIHINGFILRHFFMI